MTKQQHPVATTLSEAVAPSLFEHIPLSPALRSALEKRVEQGRSEYGTLLLTHNGRDARIDLVDEVLDAIFYAHQIVMEDGSLPCHALERLVLLAEDLVFQAGVEPASSD